MSTIEQHYVLKYTNTLEMLLQESGGKLPPVSRRDSFEGSGGRPVAQIFPVKAVRKESRYKPSPLIEVGHTGRWIEPETFHEGFGVDFEDLKRVNNDPKSAYLENGRTAMARAHDEVWIANYFGANKTGANGNGPLVAFDPLNTVAAGGNGMSMDKLRTGLKILENNNVDTSREKIICVLGPEEKLDLRADNQYINFDFRDTKPLEQSGLPGVLGIEFITSNLLPFLTGTTRRCPLFATSGVLFSKWNSIKVRMTERVDLSFMDYLYLEDMFGMTRLEEGKCAEILAVE